MALNQLKHPSDVAVPPAYLNVLSRSSRDQIWGYLKNADTILLCRGQTPVKFHAATLGWWSTVISDVLHDLGVDCSVRKPAELHMADDDASDWAYLQELMYPVRPSAQIRSNNLKAVLTLGHKYNITQLVKEGSNFINSQFLNLDPNDCGFVLDWLQLADELRLDAVVNRCVQYMHASDFTGNPPFSNLRAAELNDAPSMLVQGRDLAKLRSETLTKLLKASLLRRCTELCSACGKYSTRAGIPVIPGYKVGYICNTCSTRPADAMLESMRE